MIYEGRKEGVVIRRKDCKKEGLHERRKRKEGNVRIETEGRKIKEGNLRKET
jgi:hypothetical protein